jgi:hypothetical protein
MNRYLIIHRLRWPLLLLLTGVIALLNQADILSWGRAWPLYLILLGVLALAERATLASDPPPPPPAYPYGYAPQAGYPGGYPQGYPSGPVPTPAAAPVTGTSIVPARDAETVVEPHEPRKNWEQE